MHAGRVEFYSVNYNCTIYGKKGCVATKSPLIILKRKMKCRYKQGFGQVLVFAHGMVSWVQRIKAGCQNLASKISGKGETKFGETKS